MKNTFLNRLLYNTVTFVTSKLNKPNPFRERKINQLIADTDCQQHLDVIVRNCLHSLEQDRRYPTLGGPGDVSTSTMIRIIIATFVKLQTRYLIGVQPIDAPTGLIYQITVNDTEDVESSDTEMKHITLEVITHAVEARTRKIHAQWPLEAQQDLKAHHDIDIKQEIITAVNNEIASEIVSEHLQVIQQLAERNITQTVDQSSVDKIDVEVTRQANLIAKDTRRGAGNWIVAPTNSRYVQSYAIENETEIDVDHPLIYIGVTRTGQDLYAAPTTILDPHTILIGYKGPQEFDAGLIYSPFLLLMSGGVIADPETFQPHEVLLARYSLKEGNLAQNYYRAIKLK